MDEQDRPAPEDLLSLKAELRARWERLPPEHQASMILTLISDVTKGEWGQWLHEAIALTYPTTATRPKRAELTRTAQAWAEDFGTVFGFTATEELRGTIEHERFLGLMQAEETTLHQVFVGESDCGEFLFITASRPKDEQREALTFWGCGLHEWRDRYVLNDWHWYIPVPPINDGEQVSKDEFINTLVDRQRKLELQAQNHVQSAKGMFYERLAQITDDVAAASIMYDLGDVLDGMLGE